MRRLSHSWVLSTESFKYCEVRELLSFESFQIYLGSRTYLLLFFSAQIGDIYEEDDDLEDDGFEPMPDIEPASLQAQNILAGL